MRSYINASVTAIAMVTLLSAPAVARQATIEASSTLRLTNPQNQDESVLLYTFTLPENVQDAVIVRAKLEISGLGDDEVPLRIEALESAWSNEITWAEVFEAREDAEAGEVADAESADEGDTAANMTFIVRKWVSGELVNFGVVVAGVPWNEVESGEALETISDPPLLRIVFGTKVDEE